MFVDRMKIVLSGLLPHHAVSRAVGNLATLQQTHLKNTAIQYFIRHYGVDMESALQSDPRAYLSFNDFFTRHLKPEIRPIAEGADNFVSPVDGRISQCGYLDQGRLIQAKNYTYTSHELLGGGDCSDGAFQAGSFACFYLAPRDYHRVHMPLDGKLLTMKYIPGRLFPVRPYLVNGLDGLFTRNERIVTIFQTVYGKMAIVLVGALLVGNIHIEWHGRVGPTREVEKWDYAEQASFKKGAEMGYFCLGSTVIVLFDEAEVNGLEKLAYDAPVQYGQALGFMKK